MPRDITVRSAGPLDAAAISVLVTQLGYPSSPEEVLARLSSFGSDQGSLVAEVRDVIGCLSWQVARVLHRPKPVGRIMMLVVDDAQRGRGVGTALVEAAEARLQRLGCGLVEVTSNEDRTAAHRFYEGRGYVRTSFRFTRTLTSRA